MNTPMEPTAADLNALLDGELAAADAARVRAAIAADALVQRRVDQLRRVRRISRMALQRDGCSERPLPLRRRFARTAAVGALCGAVGIAIGWSVQRPSAVDTRVQNRTAIAAADTPANVLVHIGSGDMRTLVAGIERVEELLAAGASVAKSPRIEVLVNGTGLAAVQVDASPYAERIVGLQQRYPNVAFIACRQTMERFAAERGREPQLLPGVNIAPSALDQVVHRLQMGWTYIRI